MCIRDSFYPEQRVEDIQPYPWTVQGAGTHLNVIDCTFSNPYRAIDFGSHHHEMHYVRNVYGCPLNIGVSVDPVSYTHLDVYKRQPPMRTKRSL